jgi:uncharacterized membrane protein
MPALRLPLLIAYPVLAHASVMVHSLPLEWAALTALAAGCLYAGLSERRWKTWLAFLATAAVLAVLTEAGGGRYALYLPSLVAPLLVLLPFAESLLPGRTPLVSRIARLVHGPLPPAVVGYTRRVTWLWVLAIVLLSGIDIALMAFASRETWSLYANGLAYLLLAAVFVGEYLWRRWRFRGIDHPGFAEYLRLVARNPPHLSRP